MRAFPQPLFELASRGYSIIFASENVAGKFNDLFRKSTGKSHWPGTTINKLCKRIFEGAYQGCKVATNDECLSIIESACFEMNSALSGNKLNYISGLMQDALTRLEFDNIELNQKCFSTSDSKLLREIYLQLSKKFEDKKLYSIPASYKLVLPLIKDSNFISPWKFANFDFKPSTETERAVLLSIASSCQEFINVERKNLNLTKPYLSEHNDLASELLQVATFVTDQLKSKPNTKICITSPIISNVEDKLIEEIAKINPKLVGKVKQTAKPNIRQEFDVLLGAMRGESLVDIDKINCTNKSVLEINPKTIIKTSQFEIYLSDLIEKLQWCEGVEELHMIATEAGICLSEQSIEDFSFDIETLSHKLEKQISKITDERSDEYSAYLCTLEEASCFAFDYIWLMNINGDYLPRPIKKNPLIATIIKSEEHTKEHTKSEIELLERISMNAYEMYVSYSKHEADRELSPPLIIKTEHTLHLNKSKTSLIPIDKIQLEYVDDSKTNPLEENSKCPGGTRYIENFNNCSFMSHYANRYSSLKTNDDEEFSEAKAHGEIIHYVLEHFWRKIQSTDELNSMSDETLKREVNLLCVKAIDEYSKKYKLPAWFKDNETKNAFDLIYRFLILEGKRNFRIEELEKNVRIVISGLTFNIFIDRTEIETVSIEGEKHQLRIISDHKSGKVTPSDWLKSPCPSPQIPIYSLIDNIDGALYNSIRHDEIDYKGIIRTPYSEHIPHTGIRLSQALTWEDIRDSWRKTTENSVQNLKEGYSVPHPLSNKSCQFCNFKMVCRKNEAA